MIRGTGVHGRATALLTALCLTSLGTAGAASSRPAGADDDVLLGERASHPLSALIGVPSAGSRADDAPVRLALSYANAFMGGLADEEALLLDGETLRVTARWQRALRRCWSLGIEGGVVAHDGGRFDSGIESWHDGFGLPNAGRSLSPRNELLFAYRRGAEQGAPRLERSAAGLADTHVWLQRSVACGAREPDRRAYLRAGVKLPTGRPGDWTGSGAADVWLDVQSAVLQPMAGLRMGASAGLLLIGPSDELSAQESLAGFGALGVRYAAHPRLALHAAIDWHTPLFDSELVELGAVAASLATGFSFAPGRHSRIDVQILEDVHIDTASDITLRIALRIAPGS